jgi:cytochrome c-type biogenesis protein CcmH
MKDKQREAIGFWRKGRARWCLLAAVIALIIGLAIRLEGSVVVAQTSAPEASTQVREVTPDEVNAVARELWCPLCSGVRLDACELKACDQMKDVIAVKLAEGEDTESIQAYFVEQYGPQVMGEPPRAGFNWLAWILPAVAAVVGAYFFWRNTQRMMQPAVSLEQGLGSGAKVGLQSSVSNEQATMAAQVEAAEKLEDADEYTQKLEEELAKYG